MENDPFSDSQIRPINSTELGITKSGSLGIVSEVEADNTEFRKEYPMRLQEWEVTIQNIIDECNQEQTRVDTVLMAWRAKLEKEPTLLKPFQIDEIVRAVHQRL